MANVGDTYTDINSGRTYECTSFITISPTLITDRPTTYGVWKDTTYTSGGTPSNTIVLEDSEGNKVVAVLVDEEVDFTATANDIREGKIAATDDGVTVGEKYIPSYHTIQGARLVPVGQRMVITNLKTDNSYDYTKFQAIVCLYNTNISDSMASEMITLDDNVYKVQSNESISIVAKDHDNQTIDLGVINEFDVPCVVKYITYREVE